jgi:hypothetical protein
MTGHGGSPTQASSRPASLWVARALQAIIAAVVFGSLLIQLAVILGGGADANSGAAGTDVPLVTRLVRLFSYFTVQSNLIVAVVALLLVARPLRHGRIWEVARLDSLLGIIVTGVVYVLVLAPQLDLEGWALVVTVGLHYVTPVLAPLAWLLFGPRPRFTGWTVAAAFVWPAGWLLYTFVHGALSGWYPYPFLDAGELGLGPALVNAGLVLVAALVLAVVVAAIDRRVPALLPGAAHDDTG